MTDREFVESHWVKVNSSFDFFGFSVSLSDSPLMVFAGWEEAAEFTRERIEEIRQLEREITTLTEYRDSRTHLLSVPYENRLNRETLQYDADIFTSILSRLQKELDTLKIGMKEK